MNRCAYEQKSTMAAACEKREREMGMGMVMMMETVVCPKPRRLGVLNPSLHDHIRPIHHQMEVGDSKAGADLLDIILAKGGYQVASSPPFYCGSPPSRASNPLIQDAEFGRDKVALAPFSPAPAPLSPSSRGCVRMKFGQKPAAVRIEGFDCLSRDRRNCSISAVA